jgi:hypothetical protein
MRYLLITFVRKPGGQIDEMVTVSKRVKTSDLQICNVIMDYGKKKVDKCVIEGKVLEREWDNMNEYYRKIYPKLIEQLEKEAPITTKAKK